jgi:hypothetical protein
VAANNGNGENSMNTKAATAIDEKLVQFTNENLGLLRKRIEEALAPLGERYNLRFEMGSIHSSIPYGVANTPLKVAIKNFDSRPIWNDLEAKKTAARESARKSYKEQAELFGLKPEWLDQTFTSDTQGTFKVIGLLPRSRKRPVVTVGLNDTEMVFTASSVIRAFTRNQDDAQREISNGGAAGA